MNRFRVANIIKNTMTNTIFNSDNSSMTNIKTQNCQSITAFTNRTLKL